MIHLDPFIIEFVSGNTLTVALSLALLKGIAKIVPGVWDDKIVTLIAKMFGMIPHSIPTSTIDNKKK